MFVKPQKNMRRPVNTNNPLDRTPARQGPTTIIKPGEAPESHGLNRIVNYGKTRRSNGPTKVMKPGEATVLQTPIKNTYADFRKTQKQKKEEEKEYYRRLSAMQQRDKAARAEGERGRGLSHG